MYLARGALDLALSAADLGTAVLPHDHEIRVQRASCLVRMSRPEEAYVEAARAVSLAPRDPNAQDTLGVVLLRLSQGERALGAFRAVRTIDPGNPLYVAHEFSAAAALGRVAEACAAWAALAAGGARDPVVRLQAEQLGCR